MTNNIAENNWTTTDNVDIQQMIDDARKFFERQKGSERPVEIAVMKTNTWQKLRRHTIDRSSDQQVNANIFECTQLGNIYGVEIEHYETWMECCDRAADIKKSGIKVALIIEG